MLSAKHYLSGLAIVDLGLCRHMSLCLNELTHWDLTGIGTLCKQHMKIYSWWKVFQLFWIIFSEIYSRISCWQYVNTRYLELNRRQAVVRNPMLKWNSGTLSVLVYSKHAYRVVECNYIPDIRIIPSVQWIFYDFIDMLLNPHHVWYRLHVPRLQHGAICIITSKRLSKKYQDG